MSVAQPPVTFHPVTLARWSDLQRLFESAEPDEAGNPRGCWCMEWRLPRERWQAQAGAANRASMKSLVQVGAVPGLLAYSAGAPVGWCSVSPRTTLAGLQEAGNFRHFDDPEVWSIVCFYLIPEYRGRGVMTEFLHAAIGHATRHGARVIEAYPVDPTVPGAVGQTGFMGIQAVFVRAGFVDVAHAEGSLSLGAYTAGNRTMRHYVGPNR